MNDIDLYLEKVILEVNRFNHETLFLLRDLYKRCDWNRISRNYRLLLETLFINRISIGSLDIKSKYRNIINTANLYNW